MIRSVLFIAIYLIVTAAYSQNYSIKSSVQIWVDTSELPARLTLNWLKDPDATNYFVFKKTKSATAWGNVIATISKDSTRYVDNNVVVGTAYEYRVSKTSPLGNGFGYVYSAMKLAPTEWKGSILLLIDSTINARLKTEISTLKADLANEAWNVITYVPTYKNKVADIRKKISDVKTANPDLKTVFILGHVKVPYSGNLNPDGHPDHQGAWPADTYYADIDGSWTDVNVDNAVTASRTENQNVPGDGKFDQSELPSDADLEVGRVDFSNLPAFSKNEVELTRAYLNKDHKWRTGQIMAVKRATVLDNFNFQGEAFGQTGIKNYSVFFNPAKVEYGNYRDSLLKKSYLCSYGSGGGWYEGAGGISTTQNMAVDSLQTVFTFLFGSYFGDWDSANNFLRSALGSGTILTNAWSGRPHWVIHHMALGDHIGYCTRLSMNNSTLYNAGYAARGVHMALMGDPSLTLYPIPAVPSLKLTEAGPHIDVRWQPSPDATNGYYVYRKIVGNTIFDVIAKNVKDTVFKDLCVPNGFTYEYMVRAVKLESNASGNFYNLSAGIRDTISKINQSSPVADFTYTKDFEFIHLKSVSKNVRKVEWIIGKDTLVSSEADVVLDCSKNPQNVCLFVEGDCENDQICKSISFECSIPNITQLKIDSIKCFGGTGSIEILDLQGADPFKFQWNTGGTSNKLTNMPAGNYSVKITSAKSTDRIYNFDLTQPAELKANFTIRPADPGKMNGGIVNLAITGGTAPYSYSIPGAKLDSLAAGNYNLTITDAHGCQSVINITVPVKTFTTQVAKQLSLELYPSPTRDYIFIDLKDPSKIEKLYLMDSQGKLIKQLPVLSDKVNVSMLPGGWYTIQSITRTGVENYPFEKN